MPTRSGGGAVGKIVAAATPPHGERNQPRPKPSRDTKGNPVPRSKAEVDARPKTPKRQTRRPPLLQRGTMGFAGNIDPNGRGAQAFDTIESLFYNAPGGIAHLGASMGKDVRDFPQAFAYDLAHPSKKTTMFPRTSKIAIQGGKQVGTDLSHPLRNPVLTAVDIAGLAAPGLGAAERISAATRATGARATMKALATKPPPQVARLSHGSFQADKILSENPVVRNRQKARVKRLQKQLDRGPVEQEIRYKAGRVGEKNLSPEAVLGRERRAERRIEKDLARSPALEIQRVAGRLGKGLTRGEKAAVAMSAIEGKLAFAEPAAVVARHIATHERFIAEGVNVAWHQKWVAWLKMGQKALENPSPRLLNAARLSHDLPHMAERELVARGLLDQGMADARRAKMAGLYGREGVPEGSSYFSARQRFNHRQPKGPVWNPRPTAEFGTGKPQTGRYVPELNHSFEGTNIRTGRAPLNDVTSAIGEDYSHRMLLASAHDFYHSLWNAGDTTRRSMYQVPIRSTPKITMRLREALSRMEQLHATNASELVDLTKKELISLEQDIKASEHVNAPVGTEIPGVKWVDRRFIQDMGETSLSHPLVKLLDAVNNPMRIAMLYMAPKYAINKLGNWTMQAYTQGHLAPKMMHEAMNSRKLYGESHTAWVDSVVGSGRSLNYSVGTGIGGRLTENLAKFWNAFTDVQERRSAFYYWAHRLDYHGEKDMARLRNAKPGTETYRDVLQIARRARKDMVDFDSQMPFEKNTLRHLLFVYPWVSRGTFWAFRAMVEHPTKTFTVAQLSRIVEDNSGREPKWRQGVIHSKWGDFNLNSIWTPATAAQMFGVARHPLSKYEGVGAALTPALGGLGSMTQGGKAVALPEMLPQYSALRRAGLVGKPTKTYPDTGWKQAVGPIMLGGLAPGRHPDKAYLAKIAQKDAEKGLGKGERSYRHDLADLTAQARKFYPSGGGKIPKAVRDDLGWRRSLDAELDKLPKDPDGHKDPRLKAQIAGAHLVKRYPQASGPVQSALGRARIPQDFQALYETFREAGTNTLSGFRSAMNQAAEAELRRLEEQAVGAKG